MSDANAFGIPSVAEMPATAELLRASVGRQTLEEIRTRATRDLKAFMACHPKRWGDGWTKPQVMRPADILMMRSIAVAMTGAFAERAGSSVAGALTVPRMIDSAASFWLTGRTAWGLARTEAPPIGVDIRLPSRFVAAWFGSPLVIPNGVDLRPEWADDLIGKSSGMTDGLTAWPTAWPFEFEGCRSVIDALAPGTTLDLHHVHGMILCSDPEGRPVDVAAWIWAGRNAGGERAGGWTWHILACRPSRSAWPTLWRSLCAIVAWGDWTGERPLVAHNRGVKRRLPAGVDLNSISPVRVLDARHKDTLGATREPQGSTHASPATHLRRGHWRQQRHGQDRAETKLVWIAPTIVNPGTATDDRHVVWALPRPESIPDPAIVPRYWKDHD